MKYPFEPTPLAGFSITQFDYWVHSQKPTQIELSDRQYAHLASAMKANVKDYKGVPIVFEGVANT